MSHFNQSRYSLVAFALVMMLIPSTLQAQESQVKGYDFTTDPSVKTRFLADGMALEIPIKNYMQGEKDRFKLLALLPEAGRLELVMHHAGRVKVENVKSGYDSNKKQWMGEAQLVRDIKRLSLEQAQQQAEKVLLANLTKELDTARQERQKKKKPELEAYLKRQGVPRPKGDSKLHAMYDRVRAAELGSKTMRQELQTFMERKSQWFVKSDYEEVEQLSGSQAMSIYWELLALEIAEPYLRDMGLTFEVNPRNYREVIGGHLRGIDALLSGDNHEEKLKAVRSLPEQTRADLRQAIYVDASLRFYPETDTADANSQWFLAQKVHCVVRGIRTVRVEGRLDPAAGDSSDWWLLQSYDADKIEFTWPQHENLRREMHGEGTRQVKLRLTATGEKPIDYVMEFTYKPATSTKRKVVIVESPSRTNAKFPF